MQEDCYLMWLQSISGITYKRAKTLLSFFGSAEAVFHAKPDQLFCVPQMTDQWRNNIQAVQNKECLIRLLEQLEINHVQYISQQNKVYPKLLNEIYDPPLGLFVAGQLPENLTAISIIGSRQSSEYGMSVANKLGYDLAQMGFWVVSGMAKGIDSMAHNAAIRAKGKTVAVLGCGVDVCYPAENHLLMKQIKQNGCVVSEFALGEKPQKQNFPMRNRLISGMVEAVLVIEATEKSGTNITVEQALDQGRDVFAVPGSILSKTSTGTNKLIKMGAIPVTCAEDVLAGMSRHVKQRLVAKDSNNQENRVKKVFELATNETMVYDCIGSEPIDFYKIADSVQIPMQLLQATLTTLELKNCIKRLPGGRYMRLDGTV